jgi:type III pantothenate kinase
MAEHSTNLIVADIGNSFVKIGRFRDLRAQGIPKPEEVVECKRDDIRSVLGDWLPRDPCNWLVSSVNRDVESHLAQWVKAERDDQYALLTYRDVPIHIEVEFPEQVGMDRLAAAVAADSLRQPDQPAIVIDAGSAITVDVVSRHGAFLGGAILPGLMMSAAVLASNTDLLPLVPATYRDAPPAVLGRSTESAMRSGLYWGTIGAIKELVQNLSNQIGSEARVVISGGAAELLKDRLPFETCYVPHIVLSGIALIAQSRSRQRD